MSVFTILPSLAAVQGPEAADLYVAVALKILEVGEVAGEKERRAISCADVTAQDTEESQEKDASAEGPRGLAALSVGPGDDVALVLF